MAIVLASQSPRRQELLARIGVEDFKTLSLDIDESYPEGLSPEDTVRYIAKKKCDAAAALCAPDDLIITADTMVFLGNDRLGKPRDEEDALRMLRALSGRAHTVCTGVSVRRGALFPAAAASRVDDIFRRHPLSAARHFGGHGIVRAAALSRHRGHRLRRAVRPCAPRAIRVLVHDRVHACGTAHLNSCQ